MRGTPARDFLRGIDATRKKNGKSYAFQSGSPERKRGAVEQLRDRLDEYSNAVSVGSVRAAAIDTRLHSHARRQARAEAQLPFVTPRVRAPPGYVHRRAPPGPSRRPPASHARDPAVTSTLAAASACGPSAFEPRGRGRGDRRGRRSRANGLARRRVRPIRVGSALGGPANRRGSGRPVAPRFGVRFKKGASRWAARAPPPRGSPGSS